MRISTVILCVIGIVLATIILYATLGTPEELATRDFDLAEAFVISVLFALTVPPAAVLTWRGNKPRLALILALAFPLLSCAAILAIFLI